MTWLIAAISFALLVFLLNWKFIARHRERESERKKILSRKQAAKEKGLLVSCPLCGTDLLPGEDLVSRVYRPMNVHDQLCTINGCPHCYPSPEPGKRRVCPVCHKEVPVKDGHLIARLFNKTAGKKHVIVTGCTECCKSGANR